MESEVQIPHVKYGICAIMSPLEANYNEIDNTTAKEFYAR